MKIDYSATSNITKKVKFPETSDWRKSIVPAVPGMFNFVCSTFYNVFLKKELASD